MKGTPGVAAQNIYDGSETKSECPMVAQDSSEYNVSFVVSHKDGAEAVRAIHEEFILGR